MPPCPVFYPTLEEFSNFSLYIKELEALVGWE